MRNILSVIVLIVALGQGSKAQFTDRGRLYVDTLCSSYFWGRGYTNEGCNRTAYYLEDRFDHFKLEKLGNSYFQEFPSNFNTFPFECEVERNGQSLRTGVDFQPHPASGPGRGVFKPIYIDSVTGQLPVIKERAMVFVPKVWLDKQANKADFIDSLVQFYPLALEAGTQLTWSVDGYQTPNPIIEVKSDKFWGVEKLRMRIAAVLEKNYYIKNVVGVVKGTQYPDSFLFLTAHYDHLGGMGEKIYIPGANDNASGTAMLLTLAEYFSKNPLKYSIVFVAFAGEEAGLLGSKYFVDHSPVDLKRIKFLFNLDLMGTGADGATVVNATLFEGAFAQLADINQRGGYLKTMNKRGEAANSDHYFFTLKGVPSFFMYLQDSQYTAYHRVSDRPADLPLTRFSATAELLIKFYQQLGL